MGNLQAISRACRGYLALGHRESAKRVVSTAIFDIVLGVCFAHLPDLCVHLLERRVNDCHRQCRRVMVQKCESCLLRFEPTR